MRSRRSACLIACCWRCANAQAGPRDQQPTAEPSAAGPGEAAPRAGADERQRRPAVAAAAQARGEAAAARLAMPIVSLQSIAIPIGSGREIGADLQAPERARGLVVFAHGSGSSRFSSRNKAVAAALHPRGLATLLIDLLTPAEEAIDIHTAEYRFDIDRLGTRVVSATDWLETRPDLRSMPLGYFGASTGAAAALIAAAKRPDV